MFNFLSKHAVTALSPAAVAGGVCGALCVEYLVVLVGRYGDEGRLGEDVGTECRVFGAEAVVLIGLDDVEPRLVFVHGVENYLQ